jgi:F-box domain
MSERTISPGVDHMNSLAPRNSLENVLASPGAGHPGPIKRKWSPDHSDASTATMISQPETLQGTDLLSSHNGESPRGSKRAKVDESLPTQKLPVDTIRLMPSDRSRLPCEMWQHIFTFLPPPSLGRLICVNKTFQALVSPGSILPPPQLAAHGRLSLIDTDRLWSLSRRAFFPGMPRPLFAMSELQTWKLIRGKGCEFCGKTNPSAVPLYSTSPWTAGPGNDYIRVIWSFAVRSCGKCLSTRLQKVRTYEGSQLHRMNLTNARRPICSSPHHPPYFRHFPLLFLLHR